MNRFMQWYKRISRYSTIFLAIATLSVGAYFWLTQPKIYFESYCQEPAEVIFQQRYPDSNACDIAIFDYLSRPENVCIKAGCRRVVE